MDNFLLDFAIDGLPLHKSTSTSFWPIICKIENICTKPLFTVALYCGPNKPPLDEFLLRFINEIGTLERDGIIVLDKKYSVKIRSFCCDAPARSYIKNTKGHNAFYGCDRCFVRGESYNKRTVFLESAASLRTNINFRESNNMVQHREGSTPLEKLNIDLVCAFPLDYMHCVCLGIMRKLLFYWRDGSRIFRITGDSLTRLENRIKVIQKIWPDDFNRKPRFLNDLERWKATELRQFLLYIGPVVLKDILPHSYYNNFMILNFAITILLNENLCKNDTYINVSKTLINTFVKHGVSLYENN